MLKTNSLALAKSIATAEMPDIETSVSEANAATGTTLVDAPAGTSAGPSDFH